MAATETNRLPHSLEGWRGNLALLLLTALAYLPIFSAGFIWDDPDYIVNNANLRTWAGLWRTWTDPLSLPQYYPLTYSTFWLEYHLWGLWAPGYHAINLMCHIATALLLRRLLQRWGMTPLVALGAAALWAVHPMTAESVAWITERKNTLSALLGLCALLQLTRWEEAGGRRAYIQAVALFIAGLLAKTVVAALPAVWLVSLWWRNSRIRRDELLASLPLFVLGFAASRYTAWIEIHHVGATGPEWAYGPATGLQIAGECLAHYLRTILSPVRLSFIYERHLPATSEPIGWLFAALVVLGVAALFLLRQRIGRGPAAGAALFIGLLLPSLGFVNLFPHRYAFVADHFAYLALMPVAAMAAWALSALLIRIGGKTHHAAWALLLPVVLAPLTFARARVFDSAESLWTDTAAKNPGAWVAQLNLGTLHIDRGAGHPDGSAEQNAEVDLAMKYLLKARDLSPPGYADAHFQLGELYAVKGNLTAARTAYEEALRQDPGDPASLGALGDLDLQQGNLTEARPRLERAADIESRNPEAQQRLIRCAIAQQDVPTALRVARHWSDIDSDNAEAFAALAQAETLTSRDASPAERPAILERAERAMRNAIALAPNEPTYQFRLGQILLLAGKTDQARTTLYRAVDQDRSLLPTVQKLLGDENPPAH